ncbi:leucine-rich repeat domain-containing protein [Clostridium botulinum]|nr:leucine-rich repeat domain-containing protein [Clostridium botulinum]
MNKKILIPMVMGTYLCLSPLSVKAEDYYKWDSKVTADKNKIWTVKLSKKLNSNITGIKDKIYIKDSKGNKLDCNVRIKSSEKLLEILPPKDGYKEKENYYLYIDKSISSDNNKNLKEPVKMNFYIDGYIEFQDKNLEEEVRKAANPKDRPKGPLTYMDVSGIKELNLHNKNIKSLKGIEYLKNIKKLDISDNGISDISYLKGLDSLESLNLYNNNIDNISSISNLSKLQYLNISKNKIADISYLKSLNYLQHLDLRENKIEYINALDGKISLVHLFIANNNIRDFSAISKLKYLKSLYLSNNYSSNYDYAKDYYNNLKDKDFKLNVPIEFKDKVFEDLIRKEINKTSGYIYPKDLENIKKLDLHNAHVEKLNGIENMKTLEILNLSGTDIQDISYLKQLTNLKEVNISNTNITDIKALENSPYIKYLNINKTAVSNLDFIKNMKHIEKLYASDTKISNIPTLTTLKELDISNCNVTSTDFVYSINNLIYLNLGKVKINGTTLNNINNIKVLKNLEYLNIQDTDVVNIDVVKELMNLKKLDITGCSKIDTEVLSHLSSVEIVGNEIVMFGDKALEKEIRELIKSYSGPIYKRQISSITKLELSGKGIKDLQGLESIESLTYLDLSNNEISDISALKELRNLNKLILHKNKIGSIKPIENFKSKALKELDLSNNIIGDITALSGLSQLTRLDLSKNGIVSINSLSGLRNLQYLSLYENKISEGEESLKKLYNLNELYLKNSGVSNFDVTLAYYNNLDKKDFTTHSDFIVFNEKETSDLAKIIREILGRDENTNVYKSDVDSITELDLSKDAISKVKAKLSLTNDNIESLEGIQYFSNLNSLNLKGDSNLEGIENLMSIKSLTKLDLTGRKVDSLDNIKYLKSLKYLYLNNMDLSGGALFLEDLSNLNVLDLSNTNITDINILKGLKELNKLYLGNNKIDNLSSLEGLTKLVTLDLVGNDNITSIYALKNLINLKSLTLPKNISDYSPVASYYYNLTYKNFDLKNSNIIVIKEIKPIEKEINKGDKFTLPDFVEVTMSDGSKDSLKVHWKGNNIDTSKPGKYTYTGTVEGYLGEVKLTLLVNGEIPYGMGNSSGNILNKGFIVKDKDYVYYVNKNNGGGKIYRNKINGAEEKLLSSNTSEFLNVYGDYIYYVSNGSIYRIKKDGSKEELIKEAAASYMTVYNDFIYYFDKSKGGISRIKIDKTGYSSVVSEGRWRADSQFIVSGNFIYYTNYEDNSCIYKIKTDGTGKVKLNNIPCSQMNIIGSYIYYVSKGNLYKISIDGSNNSLIYSGNITNINVYNNYIYYVDNNDNNGLYKISLDGKDKVKLSKKTFKYINILDGDIYYISLDNEDRIFKFYQE